MTESFVVDTSAVVDFIRDDRRSPPQLQRPARVFLPIHVLGEIYSGAHSSQRVEENLRYLDETVGKWIVISPDVATARIYGRIRAKFGPIITQSKLNDLWIAALAIQHDLPLLVKDNGFDHVESLKTLHW